MVLKESTMYMAQQQQNQHLHQDYQNLSSGGHHTHHLYGNTGVANNNPNHHLQYPPTTGNHIQKQLAFNQLHQYGQSQQPSQQQQQSQYVKKLYARAIYENIAESPDELAFKRGDILTIIEQDTDGLTGWWLCTLRDRQGICPGNRLKLLPTSYDSGCFTPSPMSSPCPSSIGTSSLYTSGGSITGSTSMSSTTSAYVLPNDLYENTSQKHSKRRSWHIMPNKVVTPQKCGDVYWYDLLPSTTPSSQRNSAGSHSTNSNHSTAPSSSSSPYQNLGTMSDHETYDTPKPSVHISYESSRLWSRTPPQQSRVDDSYDIPRPSPGLLSQHNITPSSSNSSLMTSASDSLSLSSSNRSSMANMQDYDVPRRNPQSIRSATPQTTTTAHGAYDIPPPGGVPPSQSHQSLPPYYQVQPHRQSADGPKKELPLELSSALETLNKLQNEATSAVTRLLGFVSVNWRTREKLEPVLMDVKLAAVRLRTALHDLAEFGDGALGNAARADDKGLALKLRPLVKALRDADKLVHEASQTIEIHGWTVESMCRADISPKMSHGPPDSLDQLIACAQTLSEDVRQSTSFIQGNATLLFKRTISTSSDGGNHNSTWLEDYEYVSLESKESNAKKNADLRDGLPHDLQSKFDNCVKNAAIAAITNEKPALNANDKSVLVYYASQTITHMAYLTQAIDAFLQTVERNQPPKFFLAYGKFVVLSAHNLVNIGDIVHRNVSMDDVKKRVLHCADALSEALKTCVAKTKKAAQHFPSVTFVQEMVDSVVDISHLAHDLKIAMLQVVAQ